MKRVVLITSYNSAFLLRTYYVSGKSTNAHSHLIFRSFLDTAENHIASPRVIRQKPVSGLFPRSLPLGTRGYPTFQWWSKTGSSLDPRVPWQQRDPASCHQNLREQKRLYYWHQLAATLTSNIQLVFLLWGVFKHFNCSVVVPVFFLVYFPSALGRFSWHIKLEDISRHIVVIWYTYTL